MRKEYPYTESAVISQAATKTDVFTYRTQGWKDQLTAYNGEMIFYDACGNPTTYHGMTLEWDKGRELRQITSAGLEAKYSYDNDGSRVQKTVNGVTTKYYLNGAAILVQKDSAGERLDFLYDDKGNAFAFEYENAFYYYKKNIQGDIVGIIDRDGTEVVTYEYDSWGKLLILTDTTGCELGKKNPFRYKGYYYDSETGWYYLNGRYYDPEIQRMLSPDTPDVLTASVEFQSKNLYAYCDNNPVMRKDDEGEFWHIVAAGAISAAIDMGMTVAVNVASGNDWNDGLMQAGLTGFCSGMLQATGLGPVGQAVGQSLITGASEGYSLWRKSKTEEGITAVDVTLAVVNTVKTGMSGYKHSKKLPREIKECKASTRNYKRAKAGGKEGVIRRKKQVLNYNRKRVVKESLKRNVPKPRQFVSGVARAHSNQLATMVKKAWNRLKRIR